MSLRMNDLWNHLVDSLVRYRWWTLLVGILLFSIAVPTRSHLKTERRMETMLIEGDVARDDFEFLTKRFGGNEIVLCVFDVPDLWDNHGAGLERLQRKSDSLRKIDGVIDVMDLARLNRLLQSMSPPSFFRSDKESAPILFDEKNRFSVAMLELFEGLTHKDRDSTTAIVCVLDPHPKSTEDRARTLEQLQAVVRLEEPESPPMKGEAIGEPILVHDGFRMVEADGRSLGIASTIVLGLLLLIGFRSWRWTLIAIVVVQWSLMVTEACIVWFDLELTMVSSMLASLVTILGVATTIHLMMHYQYESLSSPDVPSSDTNVEPLRAALKQTIQPIFFACLTDAIGFASLLVARVGPVRDYGVMMSLASLVVLLSIFLLVPGLATLGRGGYQMPKMPGDEWIRNRLAASLQPLMRHRWSVTIFTLFLGVFALIGTMRMQPETDFIRNFRADWPMVKAYDRVEQSLGGAGIWDIILPAPAKWDAKFLDEVLRLEEELRSIRVNDDYKLTKVMSIADAEKASQSGPGSAFLSPSARIGLMQTAMPVFFSSMWSPPEDNETHGWIRIMLRSPERASAEDKLALIAEVEKTVQHWMQTSETVRSLTEQNGAGQRPRVTGHFVLLTRLISSLIADQWICFFVASLGIGLAIWFAIGNLRWTCIAMIPNAIPSVVVLGTMGWLGWKMNLGAALIASVSIGISVDSSIHYLYRLKEELAKGKSLSEGLVECQRDVGISMLLSTTALMLGFAWLTRSDFLPTVVFGATAVLTMLGGLIGNLWLMPTLLATFPERRSKP